MVKVIPNTFDGTVFKTALTFAYTFALRPGEYTIKGTKTTEHTLSFSHIKLFNSENNNFLQLCIDFGKTNRFNIKQYVTIACTCQLYDTNICVYHNIKDLIKLYKFFNFSTTKNDFLFRLHDNRVLNRDFMTHNLKLSLKKAGSDITNGTKLHGLRFGRITDLRVTGCPSWIIEKMARHSPNSKMTFYYTRMTSLEEAQQVYKFTKNHLS